MIKTMTIGWRGAGLNRSLAKQVKLAINDQLYSAIQDRLFRRDTLYIALCQTL